MVKGGGYGAAAKQKWVVKGEKDEKEEKAKAKEKATAKEETEAKPKEDKAEKAKAKREPKPKKEKVPPSDPKYDTSHEGKVYKVTELLEYFVKIKKAEEAVQPGIERNISLAARPDEDVKPEPGSRRALKEEKRKAKAPGALDDATMSGTTALSLEQATAGPTTPSATTPAHFDYSSYLNSMMWSGVPNYAAAYSTTIMLRNIPNKITREALMEVLENKGYKAKYNFLYLPIDFNSKCNVGYAFINFVTPTECAGFFSAFDKQKSKDLFPGYSSSKTAVVDYARIQGRDNNLENMKNTGFMEKLHKRPEGQPKFWDDQGKEMSFEKIFGKEGRGSDKKKTQTPTAFDPNLAALYGYYPGSPFGMFPPMMYPPVPQTPAGGDSSEHKLNALLPKATSNTMQMLRNVPKTITRQELMDVVDKDFKGKYDFLYIPDDAAEGGNRGFAFLNFESKEQAEKFVEKFNEKSPKEVFGVGGEEDMNCKVVNAKLNSIDKTIDRLRSDISAAASGEKTAKKKKDKKQKTAEAKDGEAPAEGAEAAKEEEEKKEEAPKEAEPPKDRKSWYPILIDSSGEVKDYPVHIPGKKESKGKDAPDTPSMYNPTYSGYPGYGFGGMAMPKLHPSYAKHMAGQAFYHANMPQGGRPKKFNKKDLEAVRDQVHYYFSDNNLCSDEHLRMQMDNDGWVFLDVIAGFRKISMKGAHAGHVVQAVAGSEVVEVSDDKQKVRLKDSEKRTKYGKLVDPQARKAA